MKFYTFEKLHNYLTEFKPSVVYEINEYLYLCKLQEDTHRLIDLLTPYIIVVGSVGMGKSIYCENMAKLTKGITYIEVQRLNSIPMLYRVNAHKIIEIREVDPK